MVRTTDSEVQEIISLKTLTDTTPFITTANLLVTQHLGSSGISAALLKEIEKYLAAHLVALHPDEAQVIEQKLGDSSEKYAGQFGKGLDSTHFGQNVKLLDHTGYLSSLGSGPVIDIDSVSITYD